MPFIRIAWIISLILAATTLPAGAQTLSADPESENQTSQKNQPHDSTPPVNNESDENNEDSPSKYQVIQTADMWHDSNVRTLSAGNEPVLSSNYIPCHFPGQILSPDRRTIAFTEISFPSIHTQQYLLASHYAHAPPNGFQL